MGKHDVDINFQASLIKAINEASPDGILVVNDKGIIVSHNHRFVEIWKIPKERLLGNGNNTAIGTDDAPILSTVLERVADPETFLARVKGLYDNPDLTDHCEIELRDGRTLERYSSVLRDDAGQYLGRVWFFRDITERKQIEEKLLLTQFVSDHAPEGIMWVDEQARIVYVNEAVCRNYGYTRDKLERMLVTDIDPGSRIEGWPVHWQELQTRRHLNFESTHQRKDGSIFPVEISANHVEFEGKEYNIAFIRDITLRKQENEKLLITQFVSDHAPDCIIWVDEHACIVYANEAACKEYGYEMKEMLGLHVWDLNPASTLENWPNQWRRLQQEGHLNFEVTHRRKNGSLLPVEVTANFVRYAGKELNVAFMRNVTERKKAEAELRISAVAFESQEILIITDVNGVILRVNQAFTENTGYTAEEAVGKTPRILKSGRHDAEFYREMWETLQRTGTWQGEVWDRRKNGEIYPKWLTISAVKGSDGIVTHYVGSHIDITERKAAEEEIQHLAFYDPLTKLPNRRLLMDRVQHAMSYSTRSKRKAALLFLDLDHFKMLNDTLGHDIGDQLLQQVAKRLELCVRDGDTVSRLGGDEFMLLIEGLGESASEAAAQVEHIAEKILVSLSEPYRLGTHECRSTCSIGATILDGQKSSWEELMKQADIAMYQSKKFGRDTLRFFDPDMQNVINARAVLEKELRHAINEGQFVLHYQTQVDSSRRPYGAEALIRWVHPERGLIAPGQFIPLAEENGLIMDIGQWVLETACAQLKAWQQDPLTRDLVLSVNVSARRFHQGGFAGQVRAAIRHHAINPALLKLELTESMLLADVDETIATMNSLNELGVSLALDDFGTGYSSLQYLKRLPLDQLKIDQSFVRDLVSNSNDVAIVKTIIAMAKSMDLDVIAEGVETEEQWQILRDLGCTNFQGYLFSKPVPIEHFSARSTES